jgi:NADPH2:quinone reductase
MRAIQMTEYGGPEVLKLVELPIPEPGDGEVLVKVSRAGLNFADTHRRTNTYLAKDALPLVPGTEVVGLREDTGERVVALTGDGGYAEYATASTDEKRALALQLGADVAIDGAPDGLTERLVEANAGKPVDVVFEMAGGEVFDRSLAALAPFGRLVVYGIASSEPNTVGSGSLMRRSRAVVGFWLVHCLGRPEMVDEALADLFARVARGELRVVAGPAYPLAEAGQAQRDLAERRTTGKVTLDPSI